MSQEIFELSSKESKSEDNYTSEDNDGMESKVAKVIIVEVKNLIKATLPRRKMLLYN